MNANVGNADRLIRLVLAALAAVDRRQRGR